MYNFGKLKHNIYEVAADGISTGNATKKTILKQYIKTLKESEILRTLSGIYHNIENRVDEDVYSTNEYIKENVALLQRYKISDIVKESNKLSILLEGYEMIEDYPTRELHENIHNLITTKKTAKTIDQLVESTNYIKTFINNNVKKEKLVKETHIPNSMLSGFLAEKFIKKYDSLTEDEVKLIKTVLTVNESEAMEYFDKSRTETLTKINETIKECSDIEVKSKLLDVKERLLESKYNKETFTTDIVKILNLQKNLND
jgi:hypothetical protein